MINPNANPLVSLTSLARSLWQHRSLIMQMTRREVIGRYRGSAMGLAWSFFSPILMLVVYTFVFSVVFKARWGTGIEESQTGFAIVLFVGMIVHGLFAEMANRAPGMILSNVNYVKKVVFPLEILPVVGLGAALFHTLVSFGVLLGAIFLINGSLAWTAIFFPLVIMPLLIATLGISWFLASIGVFVRDVGQTIGIFTTLLMFLSPVFYPISALPEKYQALLMLNPLTFVIEQSRAVMIFGKLPDWGGLGVDAVASLILAWAGYWWFQKPGKVSPMSSEQLGHPRSLPEERDKQGSDVAICVKNLSKCYHLYSTPRDRLKQFLWRGRRQYFREFWALREVSFDIHKGEVIGIIGRNGSGKSTLLQMVCGTLTPTTGEVSVKGRVAALLELGAGFNPEFTGRENVYMSAAIMGLSQEEIAARFEDIVEFSGIRDFIDQPVKTYSSGMYVRLAFSVAISVDPDILVIDEALSVGDGEFSRRSFDRIMALKEQNKTILFCSHSLYQVEALCNRALWINHGLIAAEGKPAEVIIAYDAFLSGKHAHNGAAAPQAEMPAQEKGMARISQVEVSTGGEPGRQLQIESGIGTLAVNVAFSSDPLFPAPSVAVCITGQDGRIVTSAGTQNDGLALERDASGNGGVSLSFDNLPLLKGRYDIHVYLMCERAIHVYDVSNMVAELNVAQHSLELGVVSIPHGWKQWLPSNLV